TGIPVVHTMTIAAGDTTGTITRSEERRVGKEWRAPGLATLTNKATNAQAIGIAPVLTCGEATGTNTDAADVPTASMAVCPSSVTEDGVTNLVYTVTLSYGTGRDTTLLCDWGCGVCCSDLTGIPVVHTMTIAAGDTTGTIT